MPGGDGTGPWGMGPMTGRAAGYCAGFPVPGHMNPMPGRGFGRAAYGYGYGGGGGVRGDYAPYAGPYYGAAPYRYAGGPGYGPWPRFGGRGWFGGGWGRGGGFSGGWGRGFGRGFRGRRFWGYPAPAW